MNNRESRENKNPARTLVRARAPTRSRRVCGKRRFEAEHAKDNHRDISQEQGQVTYTTSNIVLTTASCRESNSNLDGKAYRPFPSARPQA